MKLEEHSLKHPFGETSFEDELSLFDYRYREYFFKHAPFNTRALAPEAYLIFGRRGSGKSSLRHYFSFQNVIKDCRSIEVPVREAFTEVFARISGLEDTPLELATPQIAEIWEAIIWQHIFNAHRDRSKKIAKACISGSTSFASLFDGLLVNRSSRRADDMGDNHSTSAARKETLAILQSEPVIVALDTLEHYATSNDRMMRVLGSLIEAASNLHRKYSEQGLHVKLFIAAESASHLLEEGFVSNPLKHVRDEIYMHWRPKDLMRLLCWRLYCYLSGSEHKGVITEEMMSVNWDDPKQIHRCLWEPFFGKTLVNGLNRPEPTFPYILRHTQNRPRQLVDICNAIAKRAMDAGVFPRFSAQDIVAVVAEKESRLATEITSSYSQVYPNAGKIIEALSGCQMLFQGKLLDKLAHKTKSEWRDRYTPYLFRQILAELGIVGRVRSLNDSAKVVKADFEYFVPRRLPIIDTDMCVIHPMFYQQLHVDPAQGLRVYPFPDHPDYQDVEEQLGIRT